MSNTKILWICSDIQGTYTAPSIGNEDKQESIRKIDEIRKLKGFDATVFSFVSTMPCSEIAKLAYGELKEIVERLNKDGAKIIIGPQFGEDGFITSKDSKVNTSIKDNTKAMQMNHFISEFQKVGYDVKELVYIDDNPNINAAILLSQLEKGSHKTKVTLIEKGDSNRKFSNGLYKKEKVTYIFEKGKNLFKTGIDDLYDITIRDIECDNR